MSYVRNVFFIVLGLVTGTVAGLSIVCGLRAVLVDMPGPPTMSVRHERTSITRSRCDECAQPGDVIKISVRGPSRLVRGVAVYRDDGFIKGCVGCDDLSVIADSLGRYAIIGFQMDQDHECTLPCAGFDADAAALQRCGAFLATSEIVVR